MSYGGVATLPVGYDTPSHILRPIYVLSANALIIIFCRVNRIFVYNFKYQLTIRMGTRERNIKLLCIPLGNIIVLCNRVSIVSFQSTINQSEKYILARRRGGRALCQKCRYIIAIKTQWFAIPIYTFLYTVNTRRKYNIKYYYYLPVPRRRNDLTQY